MFETFFDANVLLYLLSEDAAKADRAEELIANGAVISVRFSMSLPQLPRASWACRGVKSEMSLVPSVPYARN